ncbi:MAG: glycosyltransferase, partial [Gemmatimonadales bacterium]|nr:glycosyltransferase [Gemmatimonadales bacterium]
MKSLLWISHLVPYPPVSGVAQRSFHLLRAAARFAEVHFRGLSQRAHHPDPGSLDRATEALSELCTTVEVLPIPAERSRLSKAALALTTPVLATPYYARWLASPDLAEAVSQCVREHRPDLIHVDTVGLMPYALRSLPTPAVLNHHNIESQLLERRAGVERSPGRRAYYWREARKLLRYERRVCRQVNGNIVVSDLDAERLRERVGDVPTAVVANGVDVEFFVPRAPLGHGDGGMIFVGGLDWYPNRDAVR